MALNLVGIGLNDEKDITVKGLELVKKSRRVYLETYTSKLNCSLKDLEKFYGKKIIEAHRLQVENHLDAILEEAKKEDVALLIVGDVFSATTHIDVLLRAKEKKVKVNIVNNASVLTAIGITGLELYKFGRTISIPFENENLDSPYSYFLENKKLGLHTLFLLDIKPDRLMKVTEAVSYLIKKGLKKDSMIVGCVALGSSSPEIKYCKASQLSLKKFPQCLIIPGNLHFKEEEALNLYK